MFYDTPSERQTKASVPVGQAKPRFYEKHNTHIMMKPSLRLCKYSFVSPIIAINTIHIRRADEIGRRASTSLSLERLTGPQTHSEETFVIPYHPNLPPSVFATSKPAGLEVKVSNKTPSEDSTMDVMEVARVFLHSRRAIPNPRLTVQCQ